MYYDAYDHNDKLELLNVSDVVVVLDDLVLSLIFVHFTGTSQTAIISWDTRCSA